MKKVIIGIDPGSKGFVTVRRENGLITYVSIAECDERMIADFFHVTRNAYPDNKDITVIMEEVHAIFGSSAKATFSFGRVFGFLLGLIVANDFSYTLIQPKDWQKEVWINDDKVCRHKADGNKMIDTKATSIAAAKRLFPNEDLRRTPNCKNYDDNKADALLISEYARRKNL